MNAEEIAAALGKAHRDGRGWKCLCPCHDDRDPSLSVVEKDGKFLVTCRAGCTQTAVVDELKRRGLWMNGHDSAAKLQIVAAYNYDEGGRLLFQVCRLYPKTFRQRRADGVGGWIWKTEGTRMVPYHLPELVAAASRANGVPWRVYVVEGEKDADRLRSQWGLTATCNPGGAGKWRGDYNKHFSGADVIVISDNDDTGRAHTQTVAANLRRTAASVRVLELPDLPLKGDISDWLDRNPDSMQSDFEALIENAEPPKTPKDTRNPAAPAPADIWEDDDDPIPPRAWLLGNTFCRQFLSELIADGGTGKTALRIAQYLSCAIGRTLTGEHVFTRCRVLLICLEDGKDELRRRLRAARLHHAITADEIKDWMYLWTPRGVLLMETDDRGKTVLGELERQLREQIELRKVDLVGIDPFVKSHGASENDNSAIDAIASLLASIAQEYDCSVDVVHHTRKGPSDPGNADLGRGASALKDAGRIVDTLTPMSREEAVLFNLDDRERRLLIRLDNGKANLAPRATDARWFKLVGINLDNATEAYPAGDTVQTVESWTPPDLFAGLTIAKANAILDQIDRGMPDGGRYSDNNAAKQRAAWKVVVEHTPDKSDKQAKAIIKTWVHNGVLVAKPYRDPDRREEVAGLYVEPTKRPG